MSRRFPLATVARVRRLQTGQARAAVATANAALTVATADVVRREQRLAAHVADAARGAGVGVGASEQSAGRFLTTAARGLALAADIDIARSVVVEREADVAGALDAWSQARTRERAVELLETRHRERVAAEALTAEQRAADDLAGAAHRRRVVAAAAATTTRRRGEAGAR